MKSFVFIKVTVKQICFPDQTVRKNVVLPQMGSKVTKNIQDESSNCVFQRTNLS
ncbi:Uncharacterized protein APZ42_013341 [Daphnia magna]|uniref:Uncharacterized protein n=1 Tax=Daphnia magna TaxID=35525 RepID=A0A162QWI5_9CRUS|nr:Uncharacterized protein APZ42_013341 [Daphnia magna]